MKRTQLFLLITAISLSVYSQNLDDCQVLPIVGNSAICHIDINDSSKPFTQNWQTEKKSVVYLEYDVGTSGDFRFFSGVLINNTNGNGIPYILTSNHTIWKQSQADDLKVYFNYENDTNGSLSNEMVMLGSGADIVASWQNGDFTLLKLRHSPPLSVDPYFAGWNRSGSIPNSGVCIHHPYGDVKKITRHTGSVASGSVGFLKYFRFFSIPSGWEIGPFLEGGIEEGSSGSPLFDSNHRVIGSLSGGKNGFCKTSSVGVYTKMGSNWNPTLDTASKKKLQPWLDPLGTNPMTLNGYQPTCNDYEGFEPNDGIPEAVVTFKSLGNKAWTCTRNSFISNLIDRDFFRLESKVGGQLTVELSDLPSGKNYDLILRSSSGATISSSTNLSDADEIVNSFILPGATFYIEINGVTGTDFSKCDDYHLKVSWAPAPCPIISPPIPSSPGVATAPGSIPPTSYPVISWNPVASATNYQLIIEKSPFGPGTEVGSKCVSGTSFQVPGELLEYNTSYRWKVLAYEGDCLSCESPFSSYFYFQTPPPPIAYCNDTTILSSNNATITDGSGANDYSDHSYCAWNINVPGAVSIKLDISFFDMGAGNDYLAIHKGSSEQAPLVGVFWKNSPAPPNIHIQGSEAFIRFYTDAAGTAGGWEATYQARFPQVSRYSYWFDDNPQGAIVVSANNASSFTLSSIPTSGLSPGEHMLHIRFKDEQGQWSPVFSQRFIKLSHISSLTYWLDDSFAQAQTMSLPSGFEVNLDTTFQLQFGSPGEHILHFRGQESQGRWTGVSSTRIVKCEPISGLTVWLDDSVNQSQFMGLVEGIEINLDSAFGFSSAGTGDHVLNYRAQGASGTQSSVQSQPFVRSANVNQLEYWVDTGIGLTQTVSLPAATDTSLSLSLNTNSFPKGNQSIHLRLVNEFGEKSSVLSQTYFRPGQANVIKKYKYWFNQSTAAIDSVILTPGMDSISQPMVLSTANLSNGIHTFHLQYQDTALQWSAVVSDTFLKVFAPLADFAPQDTQLCVLDTVQFVNTSQNSNEYLWLFGDGNSSTLFAPSHAYSAPGIYEVTLISTNTIDGISDTLVQDSLIWVHQPILSLISDTTICEGDSVELIVSGALSYNWTPTISQSSSNGDTVNIYPTQTTTYEVIGFDATGCSDTAEVKINVDSIPTVPQIQVVGLTEFCEGEQTTLHAPPAYDSYLWSNGASTDSIVVIESGAYQVQVISSAGCVSPLSIPVIITVDTIPDQPMISLQGSDTLITIDPGTGYQWLLNGMSILGATQSSYIPTQSGNYQVIAFNEDCPSDPSDSIFFLITGLVNDFDLGGYRLYPNPAHSGFWVEGSSSKPGNLTISFFNPFGQQLFTKKILVRNSSWREQFVTDGFSEGTYFCVISTDLQIYVEPVIIIK